MHYKLMLFAGQGIVEFSGANFSADAWTSHGTPYVNYVDEAAYFTDDASFVHSFMTKFDDLWTNTSSYTNYANVIGAADPALPDATRRTAAQLPAARVVRESGRRPLQRRKPKIDVDHVSHHRSRGTPTR